MVEAAETPEELLAFAKEAGYELTDEPLLAISGGEGGERFCNDDSCRDFCGFDGWNA